MPAKTREPSGLTANHTSSCAGWREKCATTCGCLPTLRTRTVPVPSMPRAIEVEILPTQSRQFTPPHPRHQRHPEESGLAVGGHEVEELLHLRSRPSLHLHAVLLTRERERLRCRVLRRRVESRPRASLPGHGRGAPRVSSTKVFGCQPQPPTTETSGGVGSLRALPETLEARPGMSGLLRPSSAVPVRWWPFARLGRWLGKEGACHDQGSPQDDEHRASDLEVTRPDGQSGDQTTKFGIPLNSARSVVLRVHSSSNSRRASSICAWRDARRSSTVVPGLCLIVMRATPVVIARPPAPVTTATFRRIGR